MFLLFVLGSLTLLAGLAWATYQSGRLLRSIPLRENLLLAPVENGVKLALVGLCVGLGLLSGVAPAHLGWTLEHPSRDLAIGLAVGLVVPFAVNRLTLWAIARWGKGVYSPVVIRNIIPRTRRDWLLVPAAMLLAVLLEEILFRSLLLGGLGAVVPPLLLVVPLGIIFGWMHGPQGPLGVLVAGALGIGLSLLFLWTGGLLAPLVAHYRINALQLVRAREEWRWLQEY
jgi:membrane protease YdiL (CAAX protease family)